MTGIHAIGPAKYTGPRAATLRPILRDLAVPGATRRFVAKSIRQAIGTPVASWADSAGSGTSLVPVASTAPLLATVGGIKAVQFNGTSDGLQQSVSMAQGHSLLMLVNITVPNTTATTTLSGSYISSTVDRADVQSSINALYVNAGQAMTIANQNVTGWRVMIVTFNGANSVMNINGIEYTGNPGALPRQVFTLGFSRGGSFANIAVGESDLFPFVLDASQRAALVAQLRAQYGI